MKAVKVADVNDLALLGLSALAFRFLPLRARERLSRLVGDAAYTLLGDTRRQIAGRLSDYFGGELPAERVQHIVREVFRQRWAHRDLVWLDRLASSKSYRQAVCQKVHIEGLEHLQAAVGRKRGVILWESFVGKRLLAKVALQERGFRLCQVHGPEHGGSSSWVGQHVIHRIYRTLEAKLLPEIIDIQYESLAYLRLLLKRLGHNEIVCVSAVGGMGHKFVAVEFLGRPQLFATGVVNLARTTGATLLPLFCYTREDGEDYLVLEKPIETAGTDAGEYGLVQGVTQYVRLLETYIRNYPAQWFWWHRHPQPGRERESRTVLATG